MTEDPKHNRQKLRSTVKMVAALRAGNVSRDHLIAISGLSRDYVHAFVTLMRGAGQIYRSGYGENARRARNVELFTLGSESDVPTITGRKRGQAGPRAENCVDRLRPTGCAEIEESEPQEASSCYSTGGQRDRYRGVRDIARTVAPTCVL